MMGEYQIVAGTRKNNAAVYRHSGGACLFVNDVNHWAVYNEELHPTLSSLYAPAQNLDVPAPSEWMSYNGSAFEEDTTLTAAACSASDPWTSDNKCRLCKYIYIC